VNTLEGKKKVGRPLKFTLEEVERKIEKYFAECDRLGKPYLITGLALYIGFNGRQQMDDYMAIDEFHDPIKRAKARVEAYYEEGLHSNSPAGRIFGLKNMGWKDKQEVEHTGKDGGPLVVLIDGGLNPDVYGPGSGSD
jgi:hypothetical protein